MLKISLVILPAGCSLCVVGGGLWSTDIVCEKPSILTNYIFMSSNARTERQPGFVFAASAGACFLPSHILQESHNFCSAWLPVMTGTVMAISEWFVRWRNLAINFQAVVCIQKGPSSNITLGWRKNERCKEPWWSSACSSVRLLEAGGGVDKEILLHGLPCSCFDRQPPTDDHNNCWSQNSFEISKYHSRWRRTQNSNQHYDDLQPVMYEL